MLKIYNSYSLISIINVNVEENYQLKKYSLKWVNIILGQVWLSVRKNREDAIKKFRWNLKLSILIYQFNC